jgi:hypothetical protein
MFFNKRRGLEEFLAGLAPKIALIFLLDVRFDGFDQLTKQCTVMKI